MGWKKINIRKYVAEVRKNLNLDISDEIIAKDLVLTLILAEFEREKGIFNDLIFKGGTLLSRNFLKYHRFSEDLDFVHKDSNKLRTLTRNQRERQIKKFIDIFTPALKKVSDVLDLDFNVDRSNRKYCTILSGRTVYIFRLYYNANNYVKVEINFIEKMFNKPKEVSVKAITDFFDSKELMFILGLNIDNFNVLSYPINEIILEKYRALLTRPSLKERDLFDLFLIKNSLDVDIDKVVEKIQSCSLIKKELRKLIIDNLEFLNNNEFFKSNENIDDLAIIKYDKVGYEKFKIKIKPILVDVCKVFVRLDKL